MKQLTTQSFLEIDQIREGVIVLKDNSLKGALMASSLNFALKSEEEQTAIVYQFQNFLNSLDFSCQVVIQSRKLNMTGYLEKLKELENKQQNELLKIQTKEYHNFIKELVATGDIMSKSFYVVVPFYPLQTWKKASKNIFKSSKQQKLTENDFQRGKQQLWQRMEFVALGLRRCGVQGVPLTTPELIELLWGLHHPKRAEVGYYPEVPPELSR